MLVVKSLEWAGLKRENKDSCLQSRCLVLTPLRMRVLDVLSQTSQEVHLRCLRKILGITWMDKVSNQDVLSRANLPGVEALIAKAQLR